MGGGPPSFIRDSSCPALLRIHLPIFGFRLQDFHFLRFGFPADSSNLFSAFGVLTPISLWVWAPSISLAATLDIDFSFFSSGYLDVSVHRVPPDILFYSYISAYLFGMRVAPFGYLRFVGRLHLPAAFRSLPRPSSAVSAKASALRSFCMTSLPDNIALLSVLCFSIFFLYCFLFVLILVSLDVYSYICSFQCSLFQVYYYTISPPNS